MSVVSVDQTFNVLVHLFFIHILVPWQRIVYIRLLPGGVFVLLYIVFTLSIGVPVVYLELIIGTRFKLGM